MTGPVQAAMKLYSTAAGSLQHVAEARGLFLLLLAAVWLTLQLVLLPKLSFTAPSFQTAPAPAQGTPAVTPSPASLGLFIPFRTSADTTPWRGGSIQEGGVGTPTDGQDGERGVTMGGSKVRGMGTIKAYSKFSQPANNGLTVGAAADSSEEATGSSSVDATVAAGAGTRHTEDSALPSAGRGRALVAGGLLHTETGSGTEGAAYQGYTTGAPRRLGTRRGPRGKRIVGSGGGTPGQQSTGEGGSDPAGVTSGVSQKMSRSENLPGLESALLATAEGEDLPRVPEILEMAKQVYLGSFGAPGTPEGGAASQGQGSGHRVGGKEGGASGAARKPQRIPAVPSTRLPLPPHLLLSPSLPSSSSSSPSSSSSSAPGSPSLRPLISPRTWPSPIDPQDMPPLPKPLPDPVLVQPSPHRPPLPDLPPGGDAPHLPATEPSASGPGALGTGPAKGGGSTGSSTGSGGGGKEGETRAGNTGDVNPGGSSKGENNKGESNEGGSNKGERDSGESNEGSSNVGDSSKKDSDKGDQRSSGEGGSSRDQAREQAASSKCDGRRVYVYDGLPSAFEELVTKCNSVCPEHNRERLCTNLPRDGLGRDFESRNFSHSYGDMKYDYAPWLPTEQHMLGVLFNARVRAHECRTWEWETADVFYVPALFGVMELCGGFEMIDSMTDMLEAYLLDQPGFKRRGGADHFAVVGQQVYSFTRGARNDTGYGAYLLARPSLSKVLFVMVERMSWDERTHSVPYPTAFHPASDSELQEWVRFVENHPRENLVSMASGARDGVRAAVIDACKNSNSNSSSTSESNSSTSAGERSTSEACKFVDCRKDCPYNFCFSDKGFCGDPRTVSTLHLSSHFCLQPPGDSNTRRSIFDALIAGCIPVFFNTEAFEKQYVWHFPQDRNSISVFFEGEKVKDGSLDFIKELWSIPLERIQDMRRRIVALIPQLVFKDHTRADPGFQIRDAFDYALDGITTTLQGRKRR